MEAAGNSGSGAGPTAGSITFDGQWSPLVIVTFVGQVSAAQYEEFLATHLEYVRRGRCLFIFDTSRSGTRLVEYRQRQVEWLEEHEPLLAEAVIATAFIITSPVIRLLANLLHHLKPMAWPQLFARGLPEALEWAEARLREAGDCPGPWAGTRVRQPERAHRA